MPSFFTHGLQGLPPTPPHLVSGGRMEHEQPFYVLGPSAAFPPRYSQNGCEFIEQYSQAHCYPKSAINMNAQSRAGVRNSREMTAAHSAMSQPMYGPMATANVLPPLRNNVQLPPMDNGILPQYRRQDMMVQEQPRKEEKATGGVAAHLDYEMDQMSDYVAEMAQGMYALYITKINLADIDFARSVYPGSSVTPQFRKYVYQILSSTRLPSSTILLGLYYLSSRMRMLSSAKVFHSGSGQVYRMLTVALLLGSKFLDDNTFQNKSWAEVSNIPVSELNSMELDWLFAFEWKIHDRIYDKQDGFASWLKHWENWRAKTVARAQESRHALAPLDTNVPRPHRVSKPLLSPEGPIPPQYQRSSTFENSWLNPTASEYSPPSAPHSGPNTPDYFAVGPWAYTNPPPPYTRTWVPTPQQYIPTAPPSQPPSYHHTPAYALPFAQSVWTGHGSSCGCLYCAKPADHYMCANPFGSMQPIVA
ncbi:putative cyclin-like protein (Clg1) [Aspergillus homomorphus CBS 101889]|uniref:Cyclin-like protein n=1 Tax=Aspergillus homomorphus (strain CBS 101889) TaxID=1450537 RepID=A0A395HXD8_ASPHC|nr:hypothetical protein BO97DRAFT_393477 [Aspergillus homomorphus CBS 101889]RAL10904.1 hypothetical protein BO97DRAFT_393477 [Aspergillus homomorphus CBS 101889]